MYKIMMFYRLSKCSALCTELSFQYLGFPLCSTLSILVYDLVYRLPYKLFKTLIVFALSVNVTCLMKLAVEFHKSYLKTLNSDTKNQLPLQNRAGFF